MNNTQPASASFSQIVNLRAKLEAARKQTRFVQAGILDHDGRVLDHETVRDFWYQLDDVLRQLSDASIKLAIIERRTVDQIG